MTECVRVAGKGLKVAEFSASCEESARVARKGVSPVVSRRAGAGRMEEEICGFGEDNMKEYSTKLARE